ncbi:MAG TPA: hypothetical protein VIT90_15575 [Lysobacter sp.]
MIADIMQAMNSTQERRARRWPLVEPCACLLFALAALPIVGSAVPRVDPALVPDTALAIPQLHFDSNGALMIAPSALSSRNDFDYLVGNWKLRNRKLKSRLTGSTEWTDFESRVEMHQILDGLGNIDKYTENSAGKPYEGVALRLFDPATRLWSIYWADGNSGRLDPPVVGSFENKVGHFFARDTYKGRKIIVVFRWDVRNPQFPIWSQAFSTDEGKTWEWNAINVSERVK